MLPIMVFAAAFGATAVALFAPELRASAATSIASPAPPETVQPSLVEREKRPIKVAAGPRFRGCNAARAAGRENIPVGDSDYRVEMDGDHDGLACEPLTYGSPAPYIPRPYRRGRVRVVR